MSDIVETEFGRLQQILSDDGKLRWWFECPGCGEWGPLSDDHLHGRESVDHASHGCPAGYHKTHDFVAAHPLVFENGTEGGGITE
jgi:hypothetical protein